MNDDNRYRLHPRNPPVTIDGETITDLRKDPAGLAHAHIERGAVDGDYVTESNPPQSVADEQMNLNGYQPLKFFDDENTAKRVEGVRRPTGPDMSIEQLPQDDPERVPEPPDRTAEVAERFRNDIREAAMRPIRSHGDRDR